MTTPQQQHDDPHGEARAQLMQALAVGATVGEAAARWAAVGMQRRAEQLGQAERAALASDAARAQAEQLARQAELELDRAERQYIAQAFDEAWLDNVDLTEAAQLWRASTLRAATGDDWARQAMARAEQRLRNLRPNLMAFYDGLRSEGKNPAEAMRAAAYGVWAQADDSTLGPRARPQAGREQAALRAGANGRALGPGRSILDDLDAAVRREAAALADGVAPELLDQLQRQWRSAGLVPPADAAGLLAEHARQMRTVAARSGPVAGATTIRIGTRFDSPDEHGRWHRTEEVPVRSTSAGLAIVADQIDRRVAAARAAESQAVQLSGFAQDEYGQANRVGGTPDLAATPVDEHRQGLARAHVTYGAADLDALHAAQAERLARAFPPLTVVQAAVPHLADKQPATIVSARQRGRAR
jgi:hypothetical protein